MSRPPKRDNVASKRCLGRLERIRSRVLDLETSLARRGAVGGRQRLGETLEESEMTGVG